MMRALFDAARAVLERRAAEIRFGTDLMRTVRLDDVVSQLRVGTGSQEGAEAAAEVALELMKNGVRAEDVEHLARTWHHSELMDELGVSTVDVLAAYRQRTDRPQAGTGE